MVHNGGVNRKCKNVRGAAPGERPGRADCSRGVRNIDDLILEQAARHLDLGDLADLLAEQPLSTWAGDQDLVLVVILITGTDEMVDLELAGIEVLDLNARAEDDGVLWQAALIDDEWRASLSLSASIRACSMP